jgi:hypothetical protein
MRTDEGCDGGVISVLAETGADPIRPLGHPDADAVTRVLARPVFVEEGDRRRRLLGRARGVLATLCLAYLVMLGVSVTALPTAGRPVAGVGTPQHGRTAASTPAGTASRSSAAQDLIRLPVHPRATLDSDGDEPVVPLRRAPAPPPTRSLPPTPAPPTPPLTARPTAPARHDRPGTTKTPRVPLTARTRTPA